MKNINSVPKDTKRHPWRKRNDKLKDYSMKGLSLQKIERHLTGEKAPNLENNTKSK